LESRELFTNVAAISLEQVFPESADCNARKASIMTESPSVASEPCAFIGLGVMGRAMAKHLAKAGHKLTVFNRTRARAQEFVALHGGKVALTPAEAARAAKFVFVCVGKDEHVRDVVLAGGGVLEGLAPGSVLIDHGTSSADLARELSQVAVAKGCGALDAPVSGGQSGAEQGTLTIMAGGRDADFERVLPLFRSYSRQARLLGPAGSGQLAKMVNQICLAGLIQALAEALNFAEAAGLDPVATVEAISQGAAQSWQMDHRHAAMIADSFDFGFAVEWMRKDLGLAFDEARRNGAALPVTALVDQFYADIVAMGGHRWDTSSLIRRLRMRS
jgi:3-hydroxyisobutyrate dehydrogenase-like beta-hydroxyacid dehydrogenase